MNNTRIAIIVSVVLVFLVLLGVLSSRVGGVSVRSASRTYELGTLSAETTTLSPGIPTQFSVALPVIPDDSSLLVLRMPAETYSLNPVPAAQLRTGVVRVTLPCRGDFYERIGQDGEVRLVLIENESSAVLAQSQPLIVLPPGQDCLFE